MRLLLERVWMLLLHGCQFLPRVQLLHGTWTLLMLRLRRVRHRMASTCDCTIRSVHEVLLVLMLVGHRMRLRHGHLSHIRTVAGAVCLHVQVAEGCLRWWSDRIVSRYVCAAAVAPPVRMWAQVRARAAAAEAAHVHERAAAHEEQQEEDATQRARGDQLHERLLPAVVILVAAVGIGVVHAAIALLNESVDQQSDRQREHRHGQQRYVPERAGDLVARTACAAA